jgi:lipoprotein-anchoring transpeptidase ErfK/SrfK
MTDPANPKTRSLVRPVAAGLSLLVVLVPLIVGLLLTSGSSTKASTTTAAQTPATKPFIPVVAKHVSLVPNRLLPPGNGTLIAQLQHATAMRSKPGGGTVITHVKTATVFGSNATFWVVRLSGGWLGVISNLAGNNKVGWIPATAATLRRVNWKLQASLSRRQLTVMHNGKPVAHYSIAVGAPADPTPTGRFDVTDRLTTGDPAGPYGCCILALSALAPHAIQDWSGGNRIAIHSTPEVESIGKPVSHGCMRLTIAEGRWLLGHIPLGTPTVITA